jgi:DNA-binding Lrp family transcriptional regulator
MAERKFWAKPIENRFDEIDIRILGMLAEDSGFSDEELETIAKKAEMTKKEVKERIKVLKKKNIILKERISLIDIFKIWDYCFITFIRTMDKERLLADIKKTHGKLKLDIIRLASIISGYNWDLMLFTCTNKISEFEEFITPILKRHNATRVWNVRALESGGWVFDPVAVPDAEEYNKRVKDILSDYLLSEIK